MKIETIKDLQKVISLCRKNNVEIIKLGELELVLKEQPKDYVKDARSRSNKAMAAFKSDTPDLIHTPDDLSPEDLLFYSATGQVPPIAGEN